MRNTLIKLSIALLISGITSQSAAQSEGLMFGADGKTVFDDNIFRVDEKKSDTIFKFTPFVAYKGLYGKHQFTAEYEGEYAVFADNTDVNYTNHNAKTELDLSLSAKWRTKVSLRYFDNVEEPGISNQNLSGATNLTKFNSRRIDIDTSYGTRQSRGQFVFKFGNQNFKYDNNGQEFRNRALNNITGTFFLRVASKSRMILEVININVSADDRIGLNQSFEQNNYLTGIAWEATGKTDGSLRIGYQDTKFDNSLIPDLDGLSYFLDLNYRPHSDSRINVSLSESARENSELELSGLESVNLSVTWTAKVASNIEMDLSYSLRQDKFGGLDSRRKDDTNRIKGQLGYKALRWLDVYAGVDYMMRDSDRTIYEFDNTRIFLGLKASFD